ncbi:hypothetical protein TREMEDRAFT_58092 [Tremella mesenterica DSM 1558]|uniref:uncharacterized protein n=1 Tax=Tremella mesenterica (strain ATCC 24925 / CBS 8224 / DSM 1558 / NBRC 9311 / NRRL Y-6157 / RJB 2259-6 / UBC 559-6) TaxID=578456 RepID=UPI0003F49801|nr:uncharacterized protein TREMEDRAFT_58092 [Tremella mesenterica DSM 1558]EIW71947.1 hypothetical protein TREMEDRAFT_58092 [Tremella mesenterica DSM 1558]
MRSFTLVSLLPLLSLTHASPVRRACTRHNSTVTAAAAFANGGTHSHAAGNGQHMSNHGFGQVSSSSAPAVQPTINTPAPQGAHSGVVPTSVASTPVVSPVPAPSSAAAPPSAPSTGGNGGGGNGGGGAAGGAVGLAVDSSSGQLSAFKSVSGSKLSWYYNWGLSPTGSGADGLEFVPMVWGTGSTSGLAAAAKSWPAGTKYVLSFNEPDQPSSVGGSAISAGDAATAHQNWVTTLGGSYLISTPAVARGGKQWLQDWVTACAGKCKYDIVSFHFYGTDADDLITYAKDFYSTFNKPLWLTEWDCTDYSSGQVCTPDQAKAFMTTVIDWIEGEGASMVQRYSWFGDFPKMSTDGNGLANADGSPNALGQYYVAL